MLYRTKPCEIEAIRWSGDNEMEVLSFVGNKCYMSESGCLMIETLEGDMKASVGDYIIKGLRGEFYPCKPDVFDQKYEPVSEAEAKWNEDVCEWKPYDGLIFVKVGSCGRRQLMDEDYDMWRFCPSCGKKIRRLE